ncbi:MAG: hypothetical protein IPK82_31595 [Polyangiaceae bacterium]|nr:hypothetical protein [Polyangiaceae bacterium]
MHFEYVKVILINLSQLGRTLSMCTRARVQGARRRWAFGLAAAVTLTGELFLAPRAAADTARRAALSVTRASGAEQCLTSIDLIRSVEGRLGKDVFNMPSMAEMVVEAHLQPTESNAGFRADLTVVDPQGKILGTRRLERAGDNCRAMDEEISLTVALLIDPEAALNPGPASHPPPVVVSQVAPPSPSPSPCPPLPPSIPANSPATSPPAILTPSRSWQITLLFGAVLGFGILPDVAVGANLRALISPPRIFPFQIGAGVWSPSTASFSEAGAKFFSATATVLGCPLWGTKFGFGYVACAGVEAGAIRAGGFGFPVSLTRDEPLLNGALEGRVVRRLWGALAGSVGVGMTIPFYRHRFYYTDEAGSEREVFLASPVAGQVDLLLGFAL